MFFLFFALLSCDHEGSQKSRSSFINDNNEDTIIVKRKSVLHPSEIDFLSKTYWYNWVAGNDTLDYRIRVSEHMRDSSVHLRFHHKRPMLLSKVLQIIQEATHLIGEDFDFKELRYISFESPLFYKDFEEMFSMEYQARFGERRIDYRALNAFLLRSAITGMLNDFLEPYNKKAGRFDIEKYQLVKKAYFSHYEPGINYSLYPEFGIHGMGLSIGLH